ncbi:MAG: acyl carrier protein [Pseudomonadota bacterium]
MSDTQQELTKLMANLFRCSEDELTSETGPGDINGWDSLGHVSLMTEIQNHFGKHIPVEDAIEIESIADIVELLNNIEAES